MLYNSENIIEVIANLNFPAGKYIVCGGSALAARGIRETKDIDIIVLPEFFEKLSKQEGWKFDTEYEGRWNRKRLTKGDVEVYPDVYLERAQKYLDIPEFIKSAEIISGIPFQPLDHLIMCKKDTAREKDLKDVALMEAYLQK